MWYWGRHMDKDEINYKFLRHLQQLEQTSPQLSKIDAQFYQKLSEYLSKLDAEAAKEQNPQKNKLIQEEIQNIKKIVLNIYEQREKKIVHAALSASRGGRPEMNNLLDIEKKLYDDIVVLITKIREDVLVKKNPEPVKQKTQEPPTQKQEPNPNQIVRVTTDIPEFIGTDMKTYLLMKDDVLTLAKEMATPLLKRGVIQQIT